MGDPVRPRRGRPPVVTEQAIVEAGVRIGLRALSVRSVANELGVAPSALYRHVDDREALEVLVGEHLISTFEFGEYAAGPVDDYLLGFALALRQFATDHPGAGAYLARPPTGSVRVRRLKDRLALALESAGLTLVDALTATTVIANHALGLTELELEARARPLARSPESDDPNAERIRVARRSMAAGDADAMFELSMRATVDGLLARIEANRVQSAGTAATSDSPRSPSR